MLSVFCHFPNRAVTFLFILSVALLNLALGLGMALVWERFAQPTAILTSQSSKTDMPPAEPEQAPPADEAPAESEISPASTPATSPGDEQAELAECVPTAWLDMLQENAVEARSFLEATAQVLRLKIINYREQLAELEDQLRRLPEESPQREALVVELINLNGHWLTEQGEAMGALVDRQRTQSELEPIACELEEILLEQHALIETSRMQVEVAQEAGTLDSLTVLSELQKMTGCAHRLRDLMQQSLAAILDVEQRYDDYEEAWLQDPLCGVTNRTGLEIMIQRWRTQQPPPQGPSSLVLIDFDQFQRTNQQHGTRLADQLLIETCKLLEASFSDAQGYERQGRYNGQQLLAFFGAADSQQAATAAEHLRQRVDATTFRCGESEPSVQVTCAVVDLLAEETLAASLQRLEQSLAAAKSHGSNCTFLDSGSGAQQVEPQSAEAEGGQIEIDSKYLAVAGSMESVTS